MQIIKTDANQFIKPEFKGKEPDPISDGKYFIYGWRWHKNEKRWETMLKGHWFKSFEWIEDTELPK